MRRKWRLWLGALLGLMVLAGGGFVLWASLGPAPQPAALAALRTGEGVVVETEPWLIFRPAEAQPATGLILYPGGRVDARAYAAPARAIAAEGYRVVIVPMPLNLAVLGSGRAADVIDAFPQIERWAVGGHSLGGAMAARFADEHRTQVAGLVLWASYPAESSDLSSADLAVVSIYGTRDGLADPETVRAARALLPGDARWVAIEGGNHAQCGDYGPQSGDNPATISRQEQQALTVSATVELLRQLEGQGD
jgi:pimeloyl-ACP methyl ester carboxylesterase